MSRRLERLLANPLLATLTDVLTVPAGHKYEIVEQVPYSDGAHDYTWAFFIHTGSTFPVFDTCVVTAAGLISHRTYEGIVLYAGDSLTVYITSAGTLHIPYYVGYIDVDGV